MVVSTPDHTHALATLGGPEAGQARLLREAADAHASTRPASIAEAAAKAQESPRRWARRSTPATTTAASSS